MRLARTRSPTIALTESRQDNKQNKSYNFCFESASASNSTNKRMGHIRYGTFIPPNNPASGTDNRASFVFNAPLDIENVPLSMRISLTLEVSRPERSWLNAIAQLPLNNGTVMFKRFMTVLSEYRRGFTGSAHEIESPRLPVGFARVTGRSSASIKLAFNK